MGSNCACPWREVQENVLGKHGAKFQSNLIFAPREKKTQRGEERGVSEKKYTSRGCSVDTKRKVCAKFQKIEFLMISAKMQVNFPLISAPEFFPQTGRKLMNGLKRERYLRRSIFVKNLYVFHVTSQRKPFLYPIKQVFQMKIFQNLTPLKRGSDGIQKKLILCLFSKRFLVFKSAQ